MNLKPEVQVPLEKVIESRQNTPIPPPADDNGRAGDHPNYKNHISPNLHILEPIPCEDCLDGSDQVELSSQEIACFKSQGFIIKHGLIDEQEGFDRLVDYTGSTCQPILWIVTIPRRGSCSPIRN